MAAIGPVGSPMFQGLGVASAVCATTNLGIRVPRRSEVSAVLCQIRLPDANTDAVSYNEDP